MNEPPGDLIATSIPEHLRACFRPGIAFLASDGSKSDGAYGVRVSFLAPSDDEPSGVTSDALPVLVLPEGDQTRGVPDGGNQILVAVEGRDTEMAAALASILLPSEVSIGLVHVTWVPGIAGSPIGDDGVDNPHASELLAFQGAREALVETADDLRSRGFSVSTHLRESKDPSAPIVEMIGRHHPAMFALGLGRHGAGIGRRVLERVRVPVLFVQAR